MDPLNTEPKLTINYAEKLVTMKLTQFFRSVIPDGTNSFVVACIGTDRSTGDSLGPLTGSLLKHRTLRKLHVYGTLHHPLHALNMEERLASIVSKHRNPFIIAVDASLGSLRSIGNFHCGMGPIQPGSALNKTLPEVGHAHVCATVNLNSKMNYVILQNTRLSIVYDMAHILANCFHRLDLQLARTVPNRLA